MVPDLNQKTDQFIFSKQTFISFKRQDPNKYYHITNQILGKGAFGTVFKGRSKQGNAPDRAIKQVKFTALIHPKMVMDQVSILMSLDYPSILKIFDVYQWNNSVYIITELCEGGELFDRLDTIGSFSQQTARTIFSQMMEGISYLHHQKISHRDIKPQNFLFLGNNTFNLKIIDFGLAFQWQQNMQLQLKKKKQRKLVGSSYYLSPEIAKFQYDQRCDIWSAGVILYMLVSGTPPFDGQTDKQIINNVKKLEYTFDIPQFDSISLQLKDLIKKILVPAPQRISIKQIFNHPWMKSDVRKNPLSVNFQRMNKFTKYSKLKKMTAIYIASQFSQKQAQIMGDLFKHLDRNKSGSIEIEELMQALQAQKSEVLHNLKQMMDSIDTDKDGKINYTQFLASMLQQDEIFSRQNLKRMFKRLDKNNSGVIQMIDLSELFRQNGFQQYTRHLQQIMLSSDKDRDGKIAYQDFEKSIQE